jgi:hypothetical protein
LSEIRNTPKNRWFIRKKKEQKKKRREDRKKGQCHYTGFCLVFFLEQKRFKKNTSLGNLNSILAAQLL